MLRPIAASKLAIGYLIFYHFQQLENRAIITIDTQYKAMFDVSRILAIPDESIDYFQMGISGAERAELKDRGFVRADGTKAKDYMIRTIKKTEKNKEKAIIKGDKKLGESAKDKDALERLDRLVELGQEASRKSNDPKTLSEMDLARKTDFNHLGSGDARQKFPTATKEIEEKIKQNPKFAIIEQTAEKANRLGFQTEGSRYSNQMLLSYSPISLVDYFSEVTNNKYLTKAERNKATSAAKSIAKTSLGNPESLHLAKLIEKHLTEN